ncbi:MAG: heparinase II/III family protein [Candidatus Latescibacteria bacterium]|nr:heparinase II/III family protein [Candidatus Latescibacterota bacterium]
MHMGNRLINNLVLSFFTVSPILFFSHTAFGQSPVRYPFSNEVLSTLNRSHPRLMMNDTELDRIKSLQKSDAQIRAFVSTILKKADEYCSKPTLSYELKEGARLMFTSRECMNRMYTLGFAWRLTGEEKYAQKAEKDLLEFCSLENWTPSLAIIYPKETKYKNNQDKDSRPPFSFLDVSESCHAAGIGYDWFYHYFSEDTRKMIKYGLIKNGLEEGVMAYTGIGNPSGKPAEWVSYNHNWNLVCNGGLIIGVLAIAESDPEYAKVVIPNAVKSLPLALVTYGPDGAWPEGPSYWGYATMYAAYGLSALESALGTDYGLTKIDGLSETGLFPIYTSGPTGLYLNFADSPENNHIRSMPPLFWLARTFNIRFIADRETEMIENDGARTEHLMWYADIPGKSVKPSLDKRFRGHVEVAVFRSEWENPDALFVGVKAGDNTFNHSQLDLGTFELDALGVRWARDLGADDYSLPGYFDFYYLTKKTGGKRWSYYRNSSFSHNVPMVNNANQDELANAHFLKFDSKPESAFVTVDLSAAYIPAVNKVTRGVAMVGSRRAVLVQDEFEISKSCDISWGMTTDADIHPDGSIAVLEQKGKQLTARILSPEGARFTIESAEQKPPQKTNEGVKRLMVHLENQTENVRLAILLSPHWEDGEIVESWKVKPLVEW